MNVAEANSSKIVGSCEAWSWEAFRERFLERRLEGRLFLAILLARPFKPHKIHAGLSLIVWPNVAASLVMYIFFFFFLQLYNFHPKPCHPPEAREKTEVTRTS